MNNNLKVNFIDERFPLIKTDDSLIKQVKKRIKDKQKSRYA